MKRIFRGWRLGAHGGRLAAGIAPVVAAVVLSSSAAANESTEPIAANVGASEFTIFWETSVAGEPELRIFADADRENEVTAGLRREVFPLAEPPRPHWGVEKRAAYRALRDEVRSRGLMVVRVSGAAPDTGYFVEAGVRDRAGDFNPAHPAVELTEVRTAVATGFVEDYRKAVIEFGEETETGSVALLSVSGARSPLLAIVGDAAGSKSAAAFSLAALVDDFTGELFNPWGSWSFEVTHYRGGFFEESMAETVGTDGDFEVAAVTTLPFEMPEEAEVAYFVFDWIDEQTAGQPFAISIVARLESGNVATDFDGTAVIDSDGELEGGPSEAAFMGGHAEDHLVTLNGTGEFVLTARDEETGAEGESEPFIVSTDWENWLSLHVDPDDLEDSMREQWLADPDGTGQPLLMRYAFDMDETATGSVIEESVEEEEEERYLAVSFPRLQVAPDVRYLVVGSDDLNGWKIVSVVEPGSPEWVTVKDSEPVNGNSRRFLRVSIVAGDTFRFWQTGEFGLEVLNDETVTGPDADPGDYGVTNLERYALGMSGIEPDLSRLPSRRIVTEEGQDYQELAFSRLTRGEDVRYIVEATSDYPNWEVISELGPGEPADVAVRDTQPVPEEGYRIIRLRVEPE